MTNQHLTINGIFTTDSGSDAVAMAMQARANDAIDAVPNEISGLPRTSVPLTAWQPDGN